MTSVTDIENMILRTIIGDRAAFSSLYNATSAKLFGFWLRILKNRVEAEDALQDVFVKAWQKSSGYAVNGYSPMTWLITVARNLAIDRLRARKTPTKNIDDAHDLVDNDPTPEMVVLQKPEWAQIDGCLAEL